jgi:hypothetical protein
MTVYDPEEWLAAETAAKDVLATEYAAGRLDIPAPVDANLRRLANAVTRSVIRTANHYLGSESYYKDDNKAV